MKRMKMIFGVSLAVVALTLVGLNLQSANAGAKPAEEKVPAKACEKKAEKPAAKAGCCGDKTKVSATKKIADGKGACKTPAKAACKADVKAKAACKAPAVATVPAVAGPTGNPTAEMLAVLKSIKSEKSAAAAKAKLKAIQENSAAYQDAMQKEFERISKNDTWLVAAGFRPGLEEFMAAATKQLEAEEKMLALLKTVKDPASAKKAQTPFKEKMMETRMMQMKQQQMGRPTPKQMEAIQAKLGVRMKAASEGMQAEQKRIQAKPELMQALLGQPAPMAAPAPAPMPAPAPAPAPAKAPAK